MVISSLVLVSENLIVLSKVKEFYGIIFLTVAYREMNISDINKSYFLYFQIVIDYLFKIEKGE